MYCPNSVDFFKLNSGPGFPNWPQTDTMTDNVKMLNTFSTGQFWTDIDTSLHDPNGEVRVWLGFPIAFLIATSEDCTTTSSTGHDITGFI
jgi:hypothetical protein